MTSDLYTFLLETEHPELATALRHALTGAGIPYEIRHRLGTHVSTVFNVPYSRLEQARSVVLPFQDTGLPETTADTDEGVHPPDPGPLKFPWGPVQLVILLSMFHLALVLYNAPLAFEDNLLVLGGVIKGRTAEEPWRLVTAIFLHTGFRHVFWNGVALFLFYIPLQMSLGYFRSVLIYFAAGIGGNLMALAFTEPGRITVGASGAIAGIFGAWVTMTLMRSRRQLFSWRIRIRTLGVALLVLPSLINPVTAAGQPVSVSGHMGGLITGGLIGALLSVSWWRRYRASAYR